MSVHAAVLGPLMRDEGFSATPYRCPAGKLTIGYGTNLDAGISQDEALFLLENRVNAAIADCRRVFPWFLALDDVRQAVVVQMVYQLGAAGVLKFHQFLEAMARGDFATAADEMLDSKWARHDSPARAQRHAQTLRFGKVIP